MVKINQFVFEGKMGTILQLSKSSTARFTLTGDNEITISAEYRYNNKVKFSNLVNEYSSFRIVGKIIGCSDNKPFVSVDYLEPVKD